MRALSFCLALFAAGCFMPPPAAERVSDAARELNVAARFGRMDVALELTSEKFRSKFLKSRSDWGRSVRIFDVELAGFSMPAKDRADVEVDYAWARAGEGTLRTTRVTQEWRDSGRGFRMVRERRVAGDMGLLGEPTPEAVLAERRDVQFATKVIR
jgi:hypothetical protein